MRWRDIWGQLSVRSPIESTPQTFGAAPLGRVPVTGKTDTSIPWPHGGVSKLCSQETSPFKMQQLYRRSAFLFNLSLSLGWHYQPLLRFQESTQAVRNKAVASRLFLRKNSSWFQEEEDVVTDTTKVSGLHNLNGRGESCFCSFVFITKGCHGINFSTVLLIWESARHTKQKSDPVVNGLRCENCRSKLRGRSEQCLFKVAL